MPYKVLMSMGLSSSGNHTLLRLLPQRHLHRRIPLLQPKLHINLPLRRHQAEVGPELLRPGVVQLEYLPVESAGR